MTYAQGTSGGPVTIAERIRHTDERRAVIRRAWGAELAEALRARERGDRALQWRHLERAHIVSQPLAGPHVRTHVAMLGFALRTGRAGEVMGQLLRILVAAPGSWTGKYPVGNTGGADVSAFRPMPVPPDLRAVLGGTSESWITPR
jgi:hypothetical protein